jgi:nanoRNase/pAp phosphatase (c-di-AMP/oligoRNAs hydrolase)
MVTNSAYKNRLDQLKNAAGAGPVLILTHANPDPDALASGKALATLLKDVWNIPSRLLYSGLVLRAENRALLTLLTPEWEGGRMPDDLGDYSAVALIDTQPGAGNNRLPESYVPQIVIDHHHPLREALTPVPFADVQPEIGATVTLLAGYLEAAGVELDSDLATAMFYGLKTDTRGLSRGTTPADISLYLSLLEQIDHRKLIQIEQAGLPQAYFQAFSRGLLAAVVYDRSIVANLGSVHRPDLPAEMADLLIRLDKARAVLCLGVHDQTLYLSIRTKPMGQDAGLLVQEIVLPPGKAGGHGTMAGGQMPVSDQDVDRLEGDIIHRFLQLMGETGEGESLS